MWWRALTHAASAKADKTTKTGTRNSVSPFESSYLSLWTLLTRSSDHWVRSDFGATAAGKSLNASGTHDDVTGLNKLWTLTHHTYTFNLSLICSQPNFSPVQMRRIARGGGATFTVRKKVIERTVVYHHERRFWRMQQCGCTKTKLPKPFDHETHPKCPSIRWAKVSHPRVRQPRLSFSVVFFFLNFCHLAKVRHFPSAMWTIRSGLEIKIVAPLWGCIKKHGDEWADFVCLSALVLGRSAGRTDSNPERHLSCCQGYQYIHLKTFTRR